MAAVVAVSEAAHNLLVRVEILLGVLGRPDHRVACFACLSVERKLSVSVHVLVLCRECPSQYPWLRYQACSAFF